MDTAVSLCSLYHSQWQIIVTLAKLINFLSMFSHIWNQNNIFTLYWLLWEWNDIVFVKCWCNLSIISSLAMMLTKETMIIYRAVLKVILLFMLFLLPKNPLLSPFHWITFSLFKVQLRLHLLQKPFPFIPQTELCSTFLLQHLYKKKHHSTLKWFINLFPQPDYKFFHDQGLCLVTFLSSVPCTVLGT